MKEDVEERNLSDNAGIGYMYGNRDGITENTYQYSTLEYENTKEFYFSESYVHDIILDRFRLTNAQKIAVGNLTENDIGKYTIIMNEVDAVSVRVFIITSINVGEETTKIGYGYVRYGSTSLVRAQTNTNNSDVKEVLDKWYVDNLLEYNEYISDTLFCNDRRLSKSYESRFTQLGYGTQLTQYRIVEEKRFNCPNKNDRFTVNDELVGNNDLTYPIGLITADEAWVSGGASTNSNYYLYTAYPYWTMTPYSFGGYFANIRVVGADGNSASLTHSIDSAFLRPVVNLKPNVLNSGDGSSSNPYTIIE